MSDKETLDTAESVTQDKAPLSVIERLKKQAMAKNNSNRAYKSTGIKKLKINVSDKLDIDNDQSVIDFEAGMRRDLDEEMNNAEFIMERFGLVKISMDEVKKMGKETICNYVGNTYLWEIGEM